MMMMMRSVVDMAVIKSKIVYLITGISVPRASKNGTPLPSARKVSTTVHRPCYRNDPKFTVMLAVWGQFIDHDISSTAPNPSLFSCCAPTRPAECLPVEIDSDDPLYEYNVTCMEFVRSAPAASCCLGPREQMNQVSTAT